MEYKNLIPGKEYTLKGVLMDKATREPFLIDGQTVSSEITFKPKDYSGYETVTFVFNGSKITESTELVVFETLYKDSVEVAVHANIEDPSQTVAVLVPEIRTTATVEGKKEIEAKGKITVEDMVKYHDLIPGKEYTVTGVLMNKATGKPFTVNGKEVRSKVTFTPETADGEVLVKFIFDATGIAMTTEVVAFETLYRENVEIAVHADIEDKSQTVTLIPPKPPTFNTPSTGDKSYAGFWIGLGAVAFGGLLSIIIVTVKRKKEDDED